MRRILVLAALAFVTSSAAKAAELRAGAAGIDITPPQPLTMWGYASRRDAPATGTRDRLKARALVLHAGENRWLIVSLDLGRAPTKAGMARLRQRLAPLSFNHILVVASHTHHGPLLELDDLPDPQNPYNRFLETRIAEIAEKATLALAPARVGVSAAESKLNRNRHSKRPDAPVDRALTVVRIESTAGQPVATLVNFAAHPTLVSARLLEWSADWPGAMCAEVEKRIGGPCLYLQGAAGDLSPRPSKPGSPEEFGVEVASEAINLWQRATPQATESPLKHWRAEMQLPCVLPVGDPLVKLALGKVFFPKLVDFYEQEYRAGVRPEVSTGLITDQLGIVAFSGEMFCGHALSLRRRARIENLIFCGYTNDYQQYFPTIESITEGGYGTTIPVAVSEPGAGERLADRALIELYRLRGQLP